MPILCIIVLLICILIDKLIKKFQPHKHTMIIEKSEMETAMGIQKASRLICSECGYIDYENSRTSIKKPESN